MRLPCFYMYYEISTHLLYDIISGILSCDGIRSVSTGTVLPEWDRAVMFSWCVVREEECVCVCGVSLQISTQGERRSGSHSVKMLFLKYTNSHIKNTDDLLIHGCGPYLKDCILVIVRCL